MSGQKLMDVCIPDSPDGLTNQGENERGWLDQTWWPLCQVGYHPPYRSLSRWHIHPLKRDHRIAIKQEKWEQFWIFGFHVRNRTWCKHERESGRIRKLTWTQVAGEGIAGSWYAIGLQISPKCWCTWQGWKTTAHAPGQHFKIVRSAVFGAMRGWFLGRFWRRITREDGTRDTIYRCFLWWRFFQTCWELVYLLFACFKSRGNPANSWDRRLQRYGEWVLRLNLALHFKLYLTKLLYKTHRVRIIFDNNLR